MTPLATALKTAHLTQQKLADLIGTSKQQVNKLVHEVNKMTPEWAQKIAPHVSMAWPQLMGWDQAMLDDLGLTLGMDEAQSANGTSDAHATRPPKRGQFVEDDSELSLLAFWRTLNEEERRFMLGLLRNGALNK